MVISEWASDREQWAIYRSSSSSSSSGSDGGADATDRRLISRSLTRAVTSQHSYLSLIHYTATNN